MTLFPILAASVAILPSDRMAMADRLFDRGAYAEAKAEYSALRGAEGVPADELLYRLAETCRVTGDAKGARAIYGELLSKHPGSRHADRARLMRALAGTPDEQRTEFAVLDSNDVPADVRAAALYHLGVLNSDAETLSRCAKVDPKGRYATAARFRRAAILAESKDPAVRRSAVSEFNELTFLPDKDRAREALYMAVRCCYADRRYGEAGPLARRYLKAYPNGTAAANVRVMAAWSFYRTGKWALAEALCEEARSDDLDYLRGACALASGDSAKAKALLEKYLETYPEGRYRAAAELPLARLDFAAASAGDDKSLIVEAARRSAALSKSSADRLRLAWALENAGRVDEATAEYAAVARDFPKTADASEALFRKAMSDARAGRWSECELALAEVVSSNAKPSLKAESQYWRGISACRMGHPEEGVAFLKDALKEGLPLDESREARLLVADDDFKAGREAEAKAAYAQLVREGACVRMNAARTRNVGRFLLGDRGGAPMPAEAAICGRALAEREDSAEWRQAGWALKGAAEEAEGSFAAAVESYRRAMKEMDKATTEDLPAAALSLGILETRAGECEKADATLRETVRLTAGDNARRVRAYLALARNCAAWGRPDEARKYATIVTTLFDDAASVAEAKRLVESLGEGAK